MQKDINSVVLTPREKDVMECILNFMSIKESARYLGISPKTIAFHRTNIFDKYNVHGRDELLRQITNTHLDIK